MLAPSSRASAVLVGLVASGGLALAGGAWGATSQVALQPAPSQDAPPALATGGDGAVVAWTHRNGVSVAALGTSDLVTSIPESDASSPLVAVDGGGTRYVAYTTPTGIVIRTVDAVGALSAARSLAAASPKLTSFAVDAAGDTAVAWTAQPVPGRARQVHLANWPTGQSTASMIDIAAPGGSDDGRVALSGGRLIATYKSIRNSVLNLLASAAGATGTEPVALATGVLVSGLAEDGAGRTYVSYTSFSHAQNRSVGHLAVATADGARRQVSLPGLGGVAATAVSANHDSGLVEWLTGAGQVRAAPVRAGRLRHYASVSPSPGKAAVASGPLSSSLAADGTGAVAYGFGQFASVHVARLSGGRFSAPVAASALGVGGPAVVQARSGQSPLVAWSASDGVHATAVSSKARAVAAPRLRATASFGSSALIVKATCDTSCQMHFHLAIFADGRQSDRDVVLPPAVAHRTVVERFALSPAFQAAVKKHQIRSRGTVTAANGFGAAVSVRLQAATR